MQSNSIAIVSGNRIPQARQGRALAQATPPDLASLVACNAVRISHIPAGKFGHLFWGLMYQTEGASVHLAKQTATAAGLSAAVPAVLVNRLCGSGLEAVIQGARDIQLGESEAVIAGSTDTMSRSSLIALSSKQPTIELHDDPIGDSTIDPYSGKRMAELADDFARRHQIERSALDEFAQASRARALKAQREGLFDEEVIGIPSSLLKTSQWGPCLQRDQLESRWTALDELTQLESPYGIDGRVTRGNSSAFADGAAAVTLARERSAQLWGCRILGRIRSWAITGAASDRMGEAMVSAMERCLEKAGLTLDQVDWFELEEAFAANCAYAIRALELKSDRVNPNGGALALGHPPATSGLRLLLHAMHSLRHAHRQYALIALAAGGSQGVAMLIENTA